nr:DUF11 domain-containing protein [Mesorhizobium sp. NBSH29]
MKPLSYARRSARWLMAAGLALASIMPVAAKAAEPVPELRLEPIERPEPGSHEIRPFFEKTGKQMSCSTVVYTLRFGMRGSPEALASPVFAEEIAKIRMNLVDELPNGLTVVGVTASGDGTAFAGGALPTATIATTADPNDTAKLSDFGLSTSDLDGSGEIGERFITVRITASIDPGAFPAPTLVDNQAFVTIANRVGGMIHIPSHDPALPDDGDFLTGQKTRIGIDLTGCAPPPPPPGDSAECFKIETGTVDCVPGGGAFIYHMPVGAELGGKTVQLNTTTPGVTIEPPMQYVPEGGGVLNWTITGALPGDTVHLVVVGIEAYAGPEEGVGLCCTQVIDIVIPEDIDCPDKPREPDLKVEKRATVERCTPEGGCTFTIRVTNVGDASYNGPIVLDEVTLPGSATIDSGPNAPWICAPATSPMQCTHPATTLAPGAFVELNIGFRPGPDWTRPAIRNCAAYNYGASGKPLFGLQTNDKACASIPICIPGRDRECTPPNEKKVDLTIRKRAVTPVCSPDGTCLFIIDVINSGTSTINGPLTVIDTYPAGVPASSTFVPSPPWACVPDGVGQFRCDHPGIVLVPGASTPIGVKVNVGPAYTADTIENCAEVLPVPGETNLANNKACAKARIRRRNPGQPGLTITKTCRPGTAAAAGSICRITVTNGGTAAPVGPVRVNDAAMLISGGSPVQVQSVAPDGGDWSCGPVPADTLACTLPGAALTPGTSRHFDVVVSANGRFENCARGSVGPEPGDDVVRPFGRACAQGGTTIKVEKTGDSQCRAGAPCTFEITIRNEGDEAYSGPVRIGDAIEVEGLGRLEGVPVTTIEPPFGCSPEPTVLPISCDATLSLGAHEARVHRVTVEIPDEALANVNGQANGRNCVAVLEPGTPIAGETSQLVPALGGRGERVACHPFIIVRKQECSAGLVMNDAGRCVCPEGQRFRNGQCVGGGGKLPVPPKKPERPQQPEKPQPEKPQACKLLPGQIRTKAGECICPRGTVLGDNGCFKPRPEKPQQCRLLPGQIRTKGGECICPRGTVLGDNGCFKPRPEKPQQCRLLPGQIRTKGGECICPRGTVLGDNGCFKPRPERPQECRLLPGQIRTKAGECICPRGTSLVRGACRQREVECPRGTVMVRGRCLEPLDLRCPRGTVGKPPNCREVRRPPTFEINPNIPEILNRLPRRERQPQIEQQQQPQQQRQPTFSPNILKVPG